MKERIFQVYGLGRCPLDYLGKVDTYPPADTKCEFTGLVIDGGGPTATSLAALSRWGISTAFAGIVGDDNFGAVIRQLLEKEQVDTSGVLVRKGSDSLAACKAVRQAGGQVVVDAGTLRERPLDLARHSDYFVASQTFARALVGHDNPLKACRKLAEFGPGVTGVTLGEKGYL